MTSPNTRIRAVEIEVDDDGSKREGINRITDINPRL